MTVRYQLRVPIQTTDEEAGLFYALLEFLRWRP